MNTKIQPGDPEITAYALGELEGADRLAVEHLLRGNPEAKKLVEEIRAVAYESRLALEREMRTAAPVNTAADPYSTASRSRVLRFPWLPYLGSGLVAACLVVMLALQESPHRPVTEIRYSQIPPGEPVIGLDDESVLMALPEVVVTTPRSDVFKMSPMVPAMPHIDISASGLLEESKKLVDLPHSEANPWDPTPPLVFAFNYGDAKSRSADAHRADRRRQLARSGNKFERSPAVSRADRYRTSNRIQPFIGDTPLFAVNDDPIVLNRLIVDGAKNLGGAGNAGKGFGRGAHGADTEAYAYRRESAFVTAKDTPLSTFIADVDSGGYANVRKMLSSRERPPVDAVHIEEMLNYFPYTYALPRGGAAFAASLEVAAAPWAPAHQLVRIGLQGREVIAGERAAANLVFIVDVSRSMDRPNKLPLVKESMRLLLGRLRADDRVAIVTYAGTERLALPSTSADRKAEISGVLNELKAEGSSDDSTALTLAYDIAKANFVTGGTNRIVLCTDGDFNLGLASEGALVRMVQEKAKSGVYLTVLGFGMGKFKDSLLQQISDRGNGSYGYIESKREAEKLMVEQVSESLVTIAKDVKIQVEFNPTKVASYRLIGFEKRTSTARNFANEQVDGAEFSSGRSMTALYEIIPVGAAGLKDAAKSPEEELRYVNLESTPARSRRVRPEIANELLTLKVRYREPGGLFSKKIEFPLMDSRRSFASASGDFRFAAAVASFGMILRDSPDRGSATLNDVAAWAGGATGADPGGYRAEFISVVERARTML